MHKYQVAIIIINYNSSSYTINCIQSVLEKTSPDISYKIIVVDNNSEKEDYQNLITSIQNDKVKIVKSHLNLGFSGGHMFGLQFAKAEFYLFLNNDSLLLNDCISIFYDFMQQHVNVGIISGKIFDEEMTSVPTFRAFPSLAFKLLGGGILRFFYPKKYPSNKKSYSNPIQVDVVSGSCMFVDANAFQKIGGFDTNYFLYCEEEDLALRLKKSGFHTYFVPQAHLQHFEGKSSTQKRYRIQREYYISYLYYQRKNSNFLSKTIIQTLLFFKLIKRGFLLNSIHFRLALFVLTGANVKYSLRFDQQISE